MQVLLNARAGTRVGTLSCGQRGLKMQSKKSTEAKATDEPQQVGEQE